MERLSESPTVGLAQPTDLPKVRDLIIAEHLDDDHDETYLNTILPNRTVLVAKEGDHMVAAAVVQNPPDQKWAAVNYLAVVPTHRRMGIAGRLLDESERLALGNGKNMMAIILKNSGDGPDSVARSFYEQRGYEPVWGHRGSWVNKKLK